MVGVLTGERLLVALRHGYEVPQARVELLHDVLEGKRKRGNMNIEYNSRDTVPERRSFLGHRDESAEPTRTEMRAGQTHVRTLSPPRYPGLMTQT